MQIHQHLAPGLGELMPGWFVVPQNPMDGPTSYVRGIGDILKTGGFAVPQNPVIDRASGVINPIGSQPGRTAMVNNKPVGVSGLGCGAPAGDCGCGCSDHGMGDISADFTKFTTDLSTGDIGTAISDPIFGIPVYGWMIGVAVLMFAGGEKHSYAGRGRRAARAAASAF